MFPDIANVMCIREALWRHKSMGCASIMVGAGFSRNADRTSSSTRPMPIWSELTVNLCHALYPMDDRLRNKALAEAGGTSGFLRLAQEFRTAFGPGALNDRIRSLVPDMDYRPGDLHKRLMRLPWSDVFSTNWDTLLERSRPDVLDRDYDVIHSMSDIPFTKRPRITKLHGSFPNYEPLIFTEEDYRTYPTQFAPFVNLVQQSMMETIFCLIGFSGDDPNFLHWSGWVRDNLGHSAPKMYLIGWLELSNHRRRMLETRNVMPIDLSALPGADKWPPDARHSYATEWFIATMEMGKPFDFLRWPSPPYPTSHAPSYLGLIPPNHQTPPRNEIFIYPVAPVATKKNDAKEVVSPPDAIGDWAHNRKLYPGWIVAPYRVRNFLIRTVNNWLHAFDILPTMTPANTLKCLSEIAWRTDKALIQFPRQYEDISYETLKYVDYLNHAIDGIGISNSSDWSDILAGANSLALALSRNARHAGNRTKFDGALQFFEPQRDHDASISNCITYEHCLWDLAVGDLAILRSRLDSWKLAPEEALWNIRKAGLLSGLHDDVVAFDILKSTLDEIRRGRHRDVDDITSFSQEGWAMFLRLAYNYQNPFTPATIAVADDMPKPFERWRELNNYDCNSYLDYQTLLATLRANVVSQSGPRKTQLFDLGQHSTSYSLIQGAPERLLSAFQMVMLGEATGVPLVANSLVLLAEGVKLAAEILTDIEPWISCYLACQCQNSDKFFERVFSRQQIAILPDHIVIMLRDASSRRVSYALTKMGAGLNRDFDSEMINNGFEILSRVSMRLSPDQLKKLLTEAIGYFRSPIFRAMSRIFGSSLQALMSRILESLPPSELADVLPMLFSLPVPKQEGIAIDDNCWADPCTLLPTWFRRHKTTPATRDPAWSAIVSQLIFWVSSQASANRSAAVYRLMRLSEFEILDDNESKQFARALWKDSQIDSSGLPKFTNLLPFAFLRLPQEAPNQARDALYDYIDLQSLVGEEHLLRALREIGDIVRELTRLEGLFSLPDSSQINLTKMIAAWATHGRQSDDGLTRAMNQMDSTDKETAEGVATIIQHLVVDDDLADVLWLKAAGNQSNDLNSFAIYPFLYHRFTDRGGELVVHLQRALLSDDEEDVSSAMHGLNDWVHGRWKYGSSTCDLLDGLVREVGIGIAARRIVMLSIGLDFARGIFQEGTQRWRDILARDCEYGLVALLREATYDVNRRVQNVPLIRAGCVRLSAAMADSGLGDNPGVAGWLNAAKNDPLPEVRYALMRQQDLEPTS